MRADPVTTRAQVAVGLVVAIVIAGLVTVKPALAIGLVGVCVLVYLAFRAPVANLVIIIGLTAIVPVTVQRHGSSVSAGLIVSDVLIIAGLLRAVPELLSLRLERRERLGAIVIGLFALVAGLQFGRGLLAGRETGPTGVEFRALFGFATYLLALPILARPQSRERLIRALIVPGITLGTWGLMQWAFHITFNSEFGVREGVHYATSASGQLQGGLYGFPVAMVAGLAVLMSGAVRRGPARNALLAMVVLNAACVLLTYERAFWVASACAVLFIVAKSGRRIRVRALALLPLVVLLAIGILAAPGPSWLVGARERALSLGQYRQDTSVRYRVVESRYVIDEIKKHPATGAGLGSVIIWGQPWLQVFPHEYHYSHDGFLWLAWKVGIPAAAALCLMIFAAILWLRPPRGSPSFRGVWTGAQAGLLLLMIASVAFPTFNTYGITAVMGLLLAICAAPPGPVEVAKTGRAVAALAVP